MLNTRVLLSVAWLGWAVHAPGQTLNFSGIDAAIPDGDPTGISNVQSVSSDPNRFIGALSVTLSISGTGFGGFNGDLYATLQHESGFAVLLNRPGTRGGFPQGYGDSGLNVTLIDSPASDIHAYRFALNGSHTTPISGPLTGVWSPDARTADPSTVRDTDARSAFLDSFAGSPVNGIWVLFLSDLSSGGTHRLDFWSLEITPIPEPDAFALLFGILLGGIAIFRRKANAA